AHPGQVTDSLARRERSLAVKLLGPALEMESRVYAS
ncbi:MAG: hypothetical protein RLY84_532, partial [Actinomycetota bacterium]